MLIIKSLADFKRFLALSGATVQLIQHPLISSIKPSMLEPRRVKKLQTNSVQFSNGSWLQFGKAGDYKFSVIAEKNLENYNEVPIVSVTMGNPKMEAWLSYKCWIAS